MAGNWQHKIFFITGNWGTAGRAAKNEQKLILLFTRNLEIFKYKLYWANRKFMLYYNLDKGNMHTDCFMRK